MSAYLNRLSGAFHLAVQATLAARGDKVDGLDAHIIEMSVWTVGVNVILFRALMAIDFFGHLTLSHPPAPG